MTCLTLFIGILFDPTKSLVRLHGLDGESFYNILQQKHHIYVEKFTSKAILVTVHACIIQEDIDALVAAIESIALNCEKGDGGGRFEDNLMMNANTKGNEGILGDWQKLLSRR